jgi:hypothetical protein
MPSYELSTDLMRALQVVRKNEEDVKEVIKKAQKSFDRAWLKISRHYIDHSTNVIFLIAAICTTQLLKGFQSSTVVQMFEIASVSVIATFFSSHIDE